MYRLKFIFAFFCLFVSACGLQPAPTATLAPAATSSVVETTAVETRLTDMPAPTQIATLRPSSTPREPRHEPTSTITPLPTIPTFTPTFDARTIVTATPAPKAVCPKEDPNLIATFEIPQKEYSFISGIQYEIQKFLNQGGSLQGLQAHVSFERDLHLVVQDITGDSIPEVIFIGYNYGGSFHVFKCNQGKYQLFSPEIDSSIGWMSQIVSQKDINKDGLPEIVLNHRGCTGIDCADIYIFEWNGENIVDISRKKSEYEFSEFSNLGKLEVKDIDNDGLFEISLWGGWPDYFTFVHGYPYRSYTEILKWNGNAFLTDWFEYDPAEFRFQTIQDADYAAERGRYEKSLNLYQDAIFDNKLEWWSQERSAKTLEKFHNDGVDTRYAKPADGTPDLTEHPRLAAYAYYRMVILHTFLGEIDAAQVKYATLQDKFPAGSPGQPYAEMATAFWDAYQSKHKMYDGCAAAIGYAAAHPEILIPLGSDYHGAQSHRYVLADVCPFR
jgi:hypothetical protein